MGNTSIRAAVSFCNENTLVKVYRYNPKYDRFETTLFLSRTSARAIL